MINLMIRALILALLVGSINSLMADISTDSQNKTPQTKQFKQNEKESGQSLIGRIEDEKRPHKRWIWETETEPYDTGWALYVDNDLFALRSADQDYTGGASLTLSGGRAKDYWYSLDPALSFVDRFSGFSDKHLSNDRQLHSLEVGFTVFTPSDIRKIENQRGDRPYASLIYLSNTHESINLKDDTALVSSFTIGVLGSKLVENVQTQIHKLTGSEKPVGWDNQISDGGELTFRYSIAKQKLFHFNYQGNNSIEVSTTWQASMGYLTEASFGMATRIGQFDTPWYSFRPQFNDYSEKSASLAGLSNAADELYFWAGFNLHVRGYNAFLQGQVKHTEFAFDHDQLRPLVADAWLGVTKQFQTGWRFSYLIRGQSSEIKSGMADRNVVWGGFILSKGW